MITLKCRLSEDTFRKYGGINGTIYKICEHLVAEPAYQDSSILVSDADEKGIFQICLGGDFNKDELIFDVTL